MANLTIDDVNTNGMNFKHLETTKDIVISPKNEYGDPARPDATHTWTAKVSDGTNYVGDYAVKINATSMVVNSADFTKLPVGTYQLEIWEEWVDASGEKQRSIYPSPRQTIGFNIYANITDQAGKEIKEIKEIGFQDVVDQAVMNIGMNYVFKVNIIEPGQTATVVQTASDGKNYVTFNIPRGDKGDKGDQGDSAYQVWLKAGHQGTEQDFFNFLKGDTGERGFRGPAGKNFNIKQTFPSISDMNASKGAGFEDGDFAMITSNVEDPDNAKLFVWNGTEYKLIGDLSGSTGMKGDTGPAPTIHGVTVNKLAAGATPTFDFIAVGDVPGNYNAVIGLPVGADGHTPVKGKDYWTEADINDLKAKIKAEVEDAILNGKW